MNKDNKIIIKTIKVMIIEIIIFNNHNYNKV